MSMVREYSNPWVDPKPVAKPKRAHCVVCCCDKKLDTKPTCGSAACLSKWNGYMQPKVEARLAIPQEHPFAARYPQSWDGPEFRQDWALGGRHFVDPGEIK